MVNTRRKESVGSSQSPSPKHRTRGSLRLIKPEPEEESGSSSVNESDSEDSADKDSSSNSPLKPKAPIKTAAPSRQLRSRFGFTGRKYNARPVRSSHKRISLDERRGLAVYSRKMEMHDDLDEYEQANESEEELYTVRGRRSRHLIRMNRIQRRTALSLRPISQKSYADPHSPLHFNSDSDGGVRRSKRKRPVNMSWLADSQMHKVGYPNLHAGYSEEDSRDAVDAHNTMEITRRITRRKNDISLHHQVFEFEAEDVTTRRRRRRNLDIEPIRESNDKENKKDSGLVNGRSSGRLRNLVKMESYMEDKRSDNDHEDRGEMDESKDQDDHEKPKVNGNVDESPKKPNDSKLPQSSNSDEQDCIPLTRLRTNPARTRTDSLPNDMLRNSTFPVTRNRTDNLSANLLRNASYPTRTIKPVRAEKVLDSSSETEEERRKYSLRDRRPKPAPKTMQTSVLRTRDIRTRRHFQRRRQDSSSSDESSSSDVRRGKPPKSPHSKNEKMKSGAGGSTKIVPIKPETLDASVRFNSIGGLDSHIQCLKEMILLPMMYPEVFRQFQIQPPRGVLFHGPPGTGKTLIARALANECSFGKRKVAFFLRKGADLLSKWIGESEKQLRLLFEQAAEMKPSIIFFDELDGLAPVRSSRQDQVHASIVSTLLALMDGLADRGEVIVIGATNRIDTIDPALRRPGRFDRELFFPLPSRSERGEILNVHTSAWSNPPNRQMLDYLSENTVGYCGSDLRALCSEAVIQSFRRTYPQVYSSEHRLLLNPENVKVEKVDFMRAKSLLVPASHRVTQGLGRKLLPILEPVLQDPMKKSLSLLEQTFPHGLSATLSKVKLSPNLRPAQLLITGDGPEHGQTSHLAPAILFKMEHIHAYLLDLAALYQESGRSAEEACILVFSEARKNIPSIVYIPNIDKWWALVSETVRAIFMSQLTQLDPNIPILFLATSSVLYNNLPCEVQNIFSHYRKEVIEVKPPTAEVRRLFFKPLIVEGSLKPMRSSRDRPKTPPPLPRAPTPPPTPLNEEQIKKLYETEEHTLRELRIFLRDMCKKLANNKLFFMFTKPVDTKEVPDYTTIIKQPMDLETMMTKVDLYQYECAKDFLNDIELICQNALEYNPARSSADKQIRHRACSLRDYAYTLIKTEMDTDFEDKCQTISCNRKKRKHCPTKYLPPYIYTPGQVDHESMLDTTLDEQQNAQDKLNEKSADKFDSRTPRKRKRSWQKGQLLVKKKKKKSLDNCQGQVDEKVSSSESKENDAKPTPTQPVTADEVSSVIVKEEHAETVTEVTTPLTINCDIQTSRVEPSNFLQSPRRRLSDLLSPSELLDNPLDFDDVDEALNEAVSENSKTKNNIECSQTELEKALETAVKMTDGYSLVSLLDLYNHLSRIVKKYSRTHIRTQLPKELSKELSRCKKEGAPEYKSHSPLGKSP
ncbi:ATPase family AAA domain-containing protein 2 isoform X2 [Leptinotarsa decemlineata]|uniref:ATPase family AAA domain-containing protein 2 isoform X2 n=1 Tax=Leptinotarsa decemlineata TaxID=7539 RepID=UPI003D3049FF